MPEVTVSQAARQRTGEIDTSRVRKEHKGDEGDEGASGLAEHVADGFGVVDRADEGEVGGPAFVAAVASAFCAHNRNGAFLISAAAEDMRLRSCAKPSECGSLCGEALHAPRMMSLGTAQQLLSFP